MRTADPLGQAYAHCLRSARGHYENFPVASFLLPARLRRPVAAIYAFARRADDDADEGTLTSEQRLAALDSMAKELHAIERGKRSEDPLFIALGDSIQKHALPLEPFFDLLSAFRQDVVQTRYADFAAVQDYCRRSANPIGRLLLHLYGAASEENLRASDAVCTALQLINFYQDLAQDCLENARVYLPQDEMRACGVRAQQLCERRNSPALQGLLQLHYRRAGALLRMGAPLGRRLRGRFGLEIRLIIAAGARVLERLEHQRRRDPFARPRLRYRDGPVILWRSFFNTRVVSP